jgi:plasmid replication initiation protein
MAKSYESMAGKYGNKVDEYSYEYAIKDFRFILGVSDIEYERIDVLKSKVFEKPIKEINNAGLGLELKSQTIKTGRKITDIRIQCKKTAAKAARKGRGRKKAEQAELPMEDGAAASREGKDLNRLREKYPAEFAELCAMPPKLVGKY